MLGPGGRYVDPDNPDQWARLMERLLQDQRAIIREVIAGTLNPTEYISQCARFNEIERIRDLIRDVAAGRDIELAMPEPLRHVEE
jgi:hypothetical protein